MKTYESFFAKYILAYLDSRTILGYRREPYESFLKKFDSFCIETYPEANQLTQKLAVEWVTKDGLSASEARGRAGAIRFLGKYIVSSGETAYILPERFFGSLPQKPHHVFSDDDLRRLFIEIDKIPEDEKVKYSKYILPVLFRLIYTCGLRPKEGRELKRCAVDLKTGEILIVQTKKKKERIVVMSDDMLKLCIKYERMQRFFYEKNEYFFPGSDTGPVKEKWLTSQFRKCWRAANPNISDETLPNVRIYDLRHRFASENIDKWLDKGKDPYAMIPRLRSYMGHTTFEETMHYIHLLPENLLKNKGIDWTSFSDIIPEVSHE